MKMLDEESLPSKDDLPFMFVESTESLIDGGYTWVGLDHFAKKTDSLAIAKEKGQVYRNFGGESPGYTKDIIGLGPSSTSAFGNYYFQATTSLNVYKKSISEGNFAIAKNFKLNQEDKIRRECNFALQCNQELDISAIEKKYKLNFNSFFAFEMEKLKVFQDKKLLEFKQNKILVTTTGRYFVRHICQVFDTFINNNLTYEAHGT